MAEIGPLSQASCCHYWKPTSGSLFPEPCDQHKPLWMFQWFSQVSGVFNNPPDGGREESVGGLHFKQINSYASESSHFSWCGSLSQGHCIIVNRKCVCLLVHACWGCTCQWCLLLPLSLCTSYSVSLVFIIWLQSVTSSLLPSGDLCVFCPAPPSSPSSPSLTPSARDTQHQ